MTTFAKYDLHEKYSSSVHQSYLRKNEEKNNTDLLWTLLIKPRPPTPPTADSNDIIALYRQQNPVHLTPENSANMPSVPFPRGEVATPGGVFGGGGVSSREEMATPKFIQGSPHFIRVTTLAGSPTPQKNSPPHHIFTQFEKQQFPKMFEIFFEMLFWSEKHKL